MELGLRDLNNQGVYMTDFKRLNFDFVADANSPTGYVMVILDPSGLRRATGVLSAPTYARYAQIFFNRSPADPDFGGYLQQSAGNTNWYNDLAFGRIVDVSATPNGIGRLNSLRVWQRLTNLQMERAASQLLNKPIVIAPPR